MLDLEVTVGLKGWANLWHVTDAVCFTRDVLANSIDFIPNALWWSLLRLR